MPLTKHYVRPKTNLAMFFLYKVEQLSILFHTLYMEVLQNMSVCLYVCMYVCTYVCLCLIAADISVDVIAGFNKMKFLSTDRSLVLQAMQNSSLVEVCVCVHACVRVCDYMNCYVLLVLYMTNTCTCMVPLSGAVNMPVCLSVCLPACLSACLPTCQQLPSSPSNSLSLSLSSQKTAGGFDAARLSPTLVTLIPELSMW